MKMLACKRLFAKVTLSALSLTLFVLTTPLPAQISQIGEAQRAVGTLFVIRTDGILEQVRTPGPLPLFEGDTLRTEGKSQGLVGLRNSIEMALNESSDAKLLFRWEKAKGLIPIVRLRQGEIWVRSNDRLKTIEVETPAATAFVENSDSNVTEFNIKVTPDGNSVLTVMQGIVGFGTSFGTCPIRTGTISFGARGKRCTKPEPHDVQSTIAWKQALNR